jgi:hypothetical protein
MRAELRAPNAISTLCFARGGRAYVLSNFDFHLHLGSSPENIKAMTSPPVSPLYDL